MKSKIFQQILDETPEDIKISMREYADFMIEKNQLSHQTALETQMIIAPLSNKTTSLTIFKEVCIKGIYSVLVWIFPVKKDRVEKWTPVAINRHKC